MSILLIVVMALYTYVKIIKLYTWICAFIVCQLYLGKAVKSNMGKAPEVNNCPFLNGGYACY